MLGFTNSDIQQQEGIVDSFVEDQQPHCLSELHSIQLLYDTASSQRTSSVDVDVDDTNEAVKIKPSQSHSLSKKCIKKASFVKRQYQSSFSKLKLQHKYKHETTKSSGKSRLKYVFLA